MFCKTCRSPQFPNRRFNPSDFQRNSLQYNTFTPGNSQDKGDGSRSFFQYQSRTTSTRVQRGLILASFSSSLPVYNIFHKASNNFHVK